MSPSPSSRSKELGHGVGAERCAGQERASRVPLPRHPRSCPSRLEDVEMTVVEDFCCLAKTPVPTMGRTHSSTWGTCPGTPPGPLRSSRPEPPPQSPQRRPSGPSWRGRAAAAEAEPSAGPLRGQHPGELRARCPGGPLPARPEGGFRGARQRRGWEPWTWPPPSGRPPPRIPQPRPERPPLTGDAETPTAQGRRRCCGARRQRRPEGGRGAGGGTARETPRSVCPGPPWGGGPGFSLPPPALGVRGAMDEPPPPPLPREGRGPPHFPAPRAREHPPGEQDRGPIS